MSFILNIDTATESASIALAREGEVLASMENEDQKDHAAWIHTAIRELMQQGNCSMQQLQAIAVTAGPGSYTGLRVGMATAKGLCYSLQIPLITESTLKMMAVAAIEQISPQGDITGTLFCPMIDARRMEVFTAVYDHLLDEVLTPQPMILHGNSFGELLPVKPMVFFGSGSKKFRELMHSPAAHFADVRHHARHLSRLSWPRFQAGNFEDPAYAEPAYLKEFHTHTKK
ncbi:MAG TPA: tRNA (adenosine(37)-N6)-threonylcarbamoyltransferase complex dimerization subunit type 1 TsaB [Chitinophagaceae bacterium]|nr:tRNA (adenosine(37)-N6)-threonylcarbamoyltransferase complex dimerization subunit type 1 TsaB [Chitinophagaceae bacterium]